MRTLAAFVGSLITAMALVAPTSASAQSRNFPEKTIRIVVPFASGSGSDADARFYGDLLSKRLGQPVIVENRTGGNSVIAVQAVKSAPADGHSILLASNTPMAVNPAILKSLPYDPFKDLKPVIGLTVGPAAFLVKADSPYRTVADAVAAAKQKKQPLAIGNYSVGYQLVAEWLGKASGVSVNHINYKGGTQAVTDVIGGSLEMAIVEPSSFLAMHKDGRVRLIGTTGAQRWGGLPDVPTMIEGGLADFETYVWASFFVRSETPDDVTQKLIQAMDGVMASPEAEAYRKQRSAERLNLKGEAMRRFQVREFERFKRLAEDAGLVQ